MRQAIQKSECKLRAFAQLAVHLDLAAVQLDELPRQREAETRALRFFVRCRPTCRNSSNTASRSSGAMPMPVSVTLTSTPPAIEFAATESARRRA